MVPNREFEPLAGFDCLDYRCNPDPPSLLFLMVCPLLICADTEAEEAKSPRPTDGVASSAGTPATLRKSDRVFRKLNVLALFLVPNPECNKIRSRVGERALAGNSSQFAPHFHSEARKVSRVSVALNRVTVLPAGANFCKACSLMAKSASI